MFNPVELLNLGRRIREHRTTQQDLITMMSLDSGQHAIVDMARRNVSEGGEQPSFKQQLYARMARSGYYPDAKSSQS